MLEKIPYYGQVIIFAIVAAGIVGMAFFVWPNISEKLDTIERYQEESQDKEQKILAGRAIEQRLPEFEREIAALQRRLGDVQQILPTQKETGDLLAWIKNVSDQSNLDLKSFSPAGLKQVEWYSEFPISMEIIGRYHDLGTFFDRVSKYSRIINVDAVRINAATNVENKSIRASFTATTFVYDAAGPEVAEEEL
jgi:type IV pilus assembly protein PilO